MHVIVGILYVGLGLLQLAAVLAGLTDWIGLPWLLAAFAAFFVAWMPIVGTVLGMFGAVSAWGWSWLAASALFLGPLVAIVVVSLMAGLVQTMLDRRRTV